MDALTALLAVVKQACHDEESGHLYHQHISAYEDAFELLEREKIIERVSADTALYRIRDNRGLDW